MAKLVLTDVSNIENTDTAESTINNNSAAIETALENTLSRDGTTPNQMEADLDMNSNRILNLPTPIDPTEPVRVIDVANVSGFQDTLALEAAVEAAEQAADDSFSAASLSAHYATDPEDTLVEPPDKYSAKHWSAKAEDWATVARYRERLTADKIWYVSLTGSDTTGDGSEGNPWKSVSKAFRYITSSVDCNGYAPVIQMFAGTYNYATNPECFEPTGFLTWGGLPSTPVVGVNVVDTGGNLLDRADSLIGAQVTGGQGIRICSRGAANRTGTDVIVICPKSCITSLQSARIIVSSLTLISQTDACLYATQGGTIEVGANVIFGGGISGALRADKGGHIAQTGNTTCTGSTGSAYAYAAGTGSVIYVGGSTNLGTGHFHNDAIIVATRGGQVTCGSVWTGSPNPTTVRYLANFAGGIEGIANINTITPALPGVISGATFAWGL